MEYCAFIPKLLAIHINTNYCHQRTSLNNKLLFILSKADRVTYKALYSISLENHTIQQLAGNNQYDICDFKVPTFQGPNLPHQHFSGAQFAGARFAGAQFAGAQYAGAQFTGDQYAEAQFSRDQLPGPNLPGPNIPGPNLPLKIARGPICPEPNTFTK